MSQDTKFTYVTYVLFFYFSTSYMVNKDEYINKVFRLMTRYEINDLLF